MGVKISCGTKTDETCYSDRILDFYTFIPFLQYVQLVFPRCLCMGNRGFGSESKSGQDASAQVTQGLTLTDVSSANSNCFIFLDKSVFVSLCCVF